MNRHVLAMGLLILIAGPAAAQPGFGQNQSPAVSPYLNLLRPGNSPGFNYYGLVRPQLQMQNDIQGLQQQVTNNKTAITDINGFLVPTTGHSTFFMNTGTYFPNRASLAGGTGQRPTGANKPPQSSSQGPPASGSQSATSAPQGAPGINR